MTHPLRQGEGGGRGGSSNESLPFDLRFRGNKRKKASHHGDSILQVTWPDPSAHVHDAAVCVWGHVPEVGVVWLAVAVGSAILGPLGFWVMGSGTRHVTCLDQIFPQASVRLIKLNGALVNSIPMNRHPHVSSAANSVIKLIRWLVTHVKHVLDLIGHSRTSADWSRLPWQRPFVLIGSDLQRRSNKRQVPWIRTFNRRWVV